MPVMLAPGVSLRPASSSDNVIQPTADAAHGLQIKENSPTQSAALIEFRSSTDVLQGFFGALTSPPPGSAGGLFGATTAQFGADLSGTFAPTQMAQLAANFTDVQMVIVGTNDNSANSAAASIVLIDPVDPVSKSFGNNLYYAAYNPAAPTPVLAGFVFGQFGTYNDAGTAAYSYGIAEATGSGYPFLIEGAGVTAATIGRVSIGASNSSARDGQLGVFCPSATRKGITIKPNSAQAVNQQEWQNSSGVAQMAVAPNGRDFILDTTTGTKWGTSTTQKQGWWNAAPVVQPVLATGAGHTTDDVIGILQTLGLCRQS